MFIRIRPGTFACMPTPGRDAGAEGGEDDGRVGRGAITILGAWRCDMPVHKVRPDISVLNDSIEVPGIGYLPVNAFVLLASQPVVIDTGLGLPDRNFLEVLGSVL